MRTEIQNVFTRARALQHKTCPACAMPENVPLFKQQNCPVYMRSERDEIMQKS